MVCLAIFLIIGRFVAHKKTRMKVEQLMVQYLYQNKRVSLQDVGIFTIAPGFDILPDNDKEVTLPDGAIQFEYNSKAPQDEGLIDFVVQHSRKIKPLATSDLESYSILSRQFLNIGKPLIIEGLGVLQKNQKGTYDFSQGHTVTSKMDAAPVAMKEKQQEEISFTTKPKEPVSSKNWMMAAVLAFVLISAGAVYYFMNKGDKEEPITQNSLLLTEKDSATVKDSSARALRDSTYRKDSLNAVPRPPGDGYSFKVVLKEYPSKLQADQAFTKLTTYGHKLLLSQKDSTHFTISIPFTTPLSDTLRAKDSLRRFFGGKPYIAF
jgi:hypothetical protein